MFENMAGSLDVDSILGEKFPRGIAGIAAYSCGMLLASFALLMLALVALGGSSWSRGGNRCGCRQRKTALSEDDGDHPECWPRQMIVFKNSDGRSLGLAAPPRSPASVLFGPTSVVTGP
ncbi:hypothetical protein QBC40DRAFT_301035 [Triangularia verruculosa]|uniref:Uncharacterized protein n=1 Tax=Triangularia verruculosa TaxID=2587418 RepID=A0AAN6X8F7_9PEZI|nr:hypothetical protein QBC40DRAFT_301035 [Triangularia verruculosa]